MANASFRSVGPIFNFATVTGVTIPKPSGVVSGDGMMALVLITSFGTTPVVNSVPSGWTQLQTFTATAFGGINLRFYWYAKFAGGSEPADYTWGFDGTSETESGDIVAYQDVLDSTFLQAISAQAAGNGTAPASTTVTTDKTNQTVIQVVYHSFGGGITYTAPGTMTERYDTDPIGIADRIQAAAGATGGFTGALSASDDWFAWTIAIYGEDSAPTAGGAQPKRRSLLGVGF